MVYTCTLSPELIEKAKKELNEDPDRRQQDIDHIRQWIKKQPHLDVRTDDMFILRFLRGCKFSLEKTKKKIDAHFTIKSILPEWFKGRDPNDPILRQVLQSGFFLPLRDPDDHGRAVILVRQGAITPDQFNLNDVNKAIYMMVDVLNEDNEEFSITGAVNVSDMKNVSISHMLLYPLPFVKKSMVLFQDGYVARHKGFHYINAPPTFDNIFNVFKGFMNEKTKKRITVHRENFEALYKEVPQRIFPKEYGGEKYSIQDLTDYWMEKLDSYRSFILEDQKNTVDESKRPGKPKTSVDIFGLEGSFRKLNVD